jgi:hypothetical protein
MNEKKHKNSKQTNRKSSGDKKDSLIQCKQNKINRSPTHGGEPFLPSDLLFLQGVIGNTTVTNLMTKPGQMIQKKENTSDVPDTQRDGEDIYTSRSGIIQCKNFNDALKANKLKKVGGFKIFEKQGRLSNNLQADLLIATKVKKQKDLLSALQYAAARFEIIAKLAKQIYDIYGGMNGAIYPRHPNQLEPFVYKISVPFTDGKTDKSIIIYYQFANATPGYVFKQELTGEGESVMTNVPNNVNTTGFAQTFFSTHADTGSKVLSKMIHQDPKKSQSSNSEILDARTKLLAEGARFNVVKNNMDKISDNTRIYMIKKGTVRWVEFRMLWQNWAGIFNSDYGIPDSVIARELERSSWPVGDGPYFASIKKAKLTSKDIKVTQ